MKNDSHREHREHRGHSGKILCALCVLCGRMEKAILVTRIKEL
jgi:ribosomal protein S26